MRWLSFHKTWKTISGTLTKSYRPSRTPASHPRSTNVTSTKARLSILAHGQARKACHRQDELWIPATSLTSHEQNTTPIAPLAVQRIPKFHLQPPKNSAPAKQVAQVSNSRLDLSRRQAKGHVRQIHRQSVLTTIFGITERWPSIFHALQR